MGHYARRFPVSCATGEQGRIFNKRRLRSRRSCSCQKALNHPAVYPSGGVGESSSLWTTRARYAWTLLRSS